MSIDVRATHPQPDPDRASERGPRGERDRLGQETPDATREPERSVLQSVTGPGHRQSALAGTASANWRS